MKSTYFCLPLLLSAIISGCAINPKSLHQASGEETIQLPNGFAYIEVWDANCEAGFHLTLQPGTYKAELKGNGGTFYRGPDPAVRREIKTKCDRKKLVFDDPRNPIITVGGVFIPDNPNAEPRLYFYNPTNGHRPIDNGAAMMTALGTSSNVSLPAMAIGGIAGAATLNVMSNYDNGKISFYPKSLTKDLRRSISKK